MSHFVLVPGANHGGWWFDPVVAALEKEGHSADPVTLAGLDPDVPDPRGVNLDTHVAEVVGLLDTCREPVVLVGHSYGGSVVTGAADARPDLVRELVYLDAFVPEDGESCWSMTNQWQHEWYVDGAGATGLAVDPLPFFDERTRPHPLASLFQRSRLTGAWTAVPRKRYLLAADPEWRATSPFVAVAERLRDDPGWSVIEAPCTHNVLRDGPDLVVSLLLAT